jgi:glycosyltransferase involved in cell wall biosynthesis
MHLPQSVQTDGVAVIMRTRDRPQFLGRAIESLLAQNFQQWALVLVNSGAPETVTTCLRPHASDLAGRVGVVHADPKQHPVIGSLTNLGILQSESRWITVLDDDDTWDPTFLSRTTARLSHERRHPDVRGVATQSDQVEDILEDGRYIEGATSPFNPTLRRVELLAMAAANLFTGNAFIYERSVLATVGTYSETLPVLDDWDFNLRFAARYDIDVIPECLAHYHRRTTVPLQAEAANTSLDAHSFFHTKIVNDYLRQDMETGKTGIGWLMALSGRLRSMSEKIGRVDKRTREMTNGQRKV